VDLPLRRLFEEPTVANLARVITESRDASAQDLIAKVGEEDDDQLLSQLAELSDEEIDSLLNQELVEEESNR
jgi:hypothetical protein